MEYMSIHSKLGFQRLQTFSSRFFLSLHPVDRDLPYRYCLRWPLAYGGGRHCAMATPSDPKNKKMKKQYCLKLASKMDKNAYF